MERSRRARRTPAVLPESIGKQLSMYALAASAAGVGMFGCAQPAEGKIVYTPAHKVIDLGQTYGLDLNHDGIVNFTLVNSMTCGTDVCIWRLDEKPGNDNAAIATNLMGNILAAALKKGARIPSGRFYHQPAYLAWSATLNGRPPNEFGNWVDVNNRYLGLKFHIKGKVHYGWARLNVHFQGQAVAGLLTGYAYETIPGKAIIAGRTSGTDEISSLASPVLENVCAPARTPATLGLLAMGSPGFSIWRRRRISEFVN